MAIVYQLLGELEDHAIVVWIGVEDTVPETVSMRCTNLSTHPIAVMLEDDTHTWIWIFYPDAVDETCDYDVFASTPMVHPDDATFRAGIYATGA